MMSKRLPGRSDRLLKWKGLGLGKTKYPKAIESLVPHSDHNLLALIIRFLVDSCIELRIVEKGGPWVIQYTSKS